MKKIILHGWLGKKFGQVFTLEVDSAAEAVRALCAQLPGFKTALETARTAHGQGFAVFYGMANLEEGELRMKTDAKTIRLVPTVIGAKNGGWLTVILGVVLIAVGVIGLSPWGQAFGGAIWGPYALNAGIAMVVGGVVQLLTPVPKKKAAEDRPQDTPSYAFNGPINTQAQGRHVPVLYGENIVGSAVVSAGISVKDFSATYNRPVIGGGGGGWSGDRRNNREAA